MFRGGFCRLCSQTRASPVISSYRKYQWPSLRQNFVGTSSFRTVLVTKNFNGGVRVECKKYFSVSTVNRFPLPPIAALVIRRVAKFFAMILGIRIRRWWSKLSEKEKRMFWYEVRKRRKQISASVAGMIGLFGIYCAAHTEVDPITGNRRLILFTQQQMMELANSITNELLQKDYKDAVYPPSHPFYRRAMSIAMQVINANKPYDRLEDFKWFLIVVNDPRINALVLSNGMIIVFSGLLNVANDDQLGAVLSHEISHCLLDHHAVSLSRKYLLEMLWLIPVIIIWTIFPIPEATLGYILGHYLKNVTILLPYERDLEIEADKYGLMLAANACIDIRQAPLFWKKMERFDPGDKETWWLSTHPSHSTRVKYIENLLPYALQLRQQNGCPPLDRSYWSRFSLF